MLYESDALDIDTEAIYDKSLKNGKAAGNDGIKIEIIKYGGDATIGQFTKLRNPK